MTKCTARNRRRQGSAPTRCRRARPPRRRRPTTSSSCPVDRKLAAIGSAQHAASMGASTSTIARLRRRDHLFYRRDVDPVVGKQRDRDSMVSVAVLRLRQRGDAEEIELDRHLGREPAGRAWPDPGGKVVVTMLVVRPPARGYRPWRRPFRARMRTPRRCGGLPGRTCSSKTGAPGLSEVILEALRARCRMADRRCVACSAERRPRRPARDNPTPSCSAK